ncbi:glycosyltransferase family 4 protein [Caulobacter segnis]
MTRVLVFSTLYPNAAQPNHGIFVENRLAHTLELGGLQATVIAPAPYFPSRNPMFGRYAVFAQIPASEVRRGVEVLHPRYLVAPKIGNRLTPWTLYRAGLRAARALRAKGQTFDVIDAHYFFPDGVAAAALGRALGLPVVITARGTDLTLIPRDPGARRAIAWAVQEAAACVAVCDDLRKRLMALGAPEDRTLTLRNGVDLERFSLGDRAACRARLGLSGFVLLSVGSLIPRKGHALTIEAMRRYPDGLLLIAGSGPLRAELEALARALGVADRVRFLGETPHADLPDLYRAADIMVLASEREGWANVLLEAMASGTPVVATAVNGAPEVVRSPSAGVLVGERTVERLVEAIDRLRQTRPSREETRRYAEAFSWSTVAAANKTLLRSVAACGYRGRYSPGIMQGVRRLLAGDVARARP